MKRILKTLGRLYPRAWRERYGEEFDAILEDRKPCLLDIADVLLGAFRMRVSVRHLVQIVLPCGLAGAIIAWGIAARTPARYSSDAVVNFTSDRLTAVCSNPDELPATLRPSKGACGESRAVKDKGMQAWIQPALDRDFLISVIKSKGSTGSSNSPMFPSSNLSTPCGRISIFARSVQQRMALPLRLTESNSSTRNLVSHRM